MSWVEILAILSVRCGARNVLHEHHDSPARRGFGQQRPILCLRIFRSLVPVLILHSILFPVNTLRLLQFYRLVRDVRDAHRGDLPIQSLLPYMTAQNLRLRGKPSSAREMKADRRAIFRSMARLKFLELGKTLEPGAVLRENSSASLPAVSERTATIVCRTDCRLYALSEGKAKQLFFKMHPSASP